MVWQFLSIGKTISHTSLKNILKNCELNLNDFVFFKSVWQKNVIFWQFLTMGETMSHIVSKNRAIFDFDVFTLQERLAGECHGLAVSGNGQNCFS